MPFCDTEAQELPRGQVCHHSGQVCHHAKGVAGQASLMQAESCHPGRTLTAVSNMSYLCWCFDSFSTIKVSVYMGIHISCLTLAK